MMNDARPFIRSHPLMMVFPGIAITATVLAFHLLGDGMREKLDPRSEVEKQF
jgi:ABC-type dipeptide/oligopeptide/nickel transport system permease subunit